ncbi:hypothetical protein BWI17_19360 [Betaproteobacteria bacterium GR16-43]|nr:hypothetical protein BWI17_19360 [Betaproteobacteria bacterium GR16-43]
MTQIVRKALSILSTAFVVLGAPVALASEAAKGVVSPAPDRVYTFDSPEKFILFFPGTGGHAGKNMSWVYNDANRPAAFSKANAIAQIQQSMAAWSAVCPITFTYLGESATGFNSSDHVNVIGWTTTDLTAPTTGVTQVAANGINITDADIKLNAAYSVTYTPNLLPTAIHEVGHAIGLNHSDVNGAVMSGPPTSSYNGSSTLAADDIAGCVSLYGSGGGGPGPDTQAPTVPTSLSATATGTTTINLTWTASSDNVGVTRYNIYNGATLIGNVPSVGATVSMLTAGTFYTFTIAACDAAGNCSAQSSPASATTQSVPTTDTQAPSVPTNLTAIPAGSTVITLTWTASTDNVGVANYKVFRSGTQVATSVGTNTSVGSLSPNTAYSFTVAACDAAGNCSGQSNVATASTTGSVGVDTTPPSVVNGLTATPANGTLINLNWLTSSDNVGVANYRVFVNGTLRQTVITSNAGVSGLTPLTTYTFTVSACDAAGNCSALSNPVSARTLAGSTSTTNYQDLWWIPAENGWGLTITQHGEALFMAWYIYDTAGKPIWVIMSSGSWDAAHTTYSGNVYIPAGSWFASYDTSKFNVGSPVGTASFRFTGPSNAVLTYNVNGVSGTKNIERQLFGIVNNAPIANYTDMWWGGASQNGWGIVLTQQYHNIFGAWFTYDDTGKTTWYVMTAGSWTSTDTYSGELYKTHGTPVLGTGYNASALTITPVGQLTLKFTDTNNATMTYTVDGITQTKAITRLPF